MSQTLAGCWIPLNPSVLSKPGNRIKLSAPPGWSSAKSVISYTLFWTMINKSSGLLCFATSARDHSYKKTQVKSREHQPNISEGQRLRLVCTNHGTLCWILQLTKTHPLFCTARSDACLGESLEVLGYSLSLSLSQCVSHLHFTVLDAMSYQRKRMQQHDIGMVENDTVLRFVNMWRLVLFASRALLSTKPTRISRFTHSC